MACLTDGQKRVLWRRHHEEHARAFEAWVAAGYEPMRPAMAVLPEVCRGLECGSKTRAGSTCKLTSNFLNGRCKLHGGLSTGPKTKKGKARPARNGLAPKMLRKMDSTKRPVVSKQVSKQSEVCEAMVVAEVSAQAQSTTGTQQRLVRRLVRTESRLTRRAMPQLAPLKLTKT